MKVLQYKKRDGKTPPFRGSSGDILPNSIAEINYFRLGDVEQRVMIRGENITNPVLIMLHGGPGFSETGLFRYFNAPLEKKFTVVYWDQRGAGKSFNPKIPRSSMTVEQHITDLNELINIICNRLHKDKVTIFGHSWGSVLGVLYSVRFPAKVAAYVGSGQIGDWQGGEALSYEYALAKAHRVGNRKAVKGLSAIGPPPYSAESLWTERTWLQRLDGQLSISSLWKLLRVVISDKESSIFDLPESFRAFRWIFFIMWSEVSKLNLLKLAPNLNMPVFFFLGRMDHIVPSGTSVSYFEKLTAPTKKLVWFEKSGHEPFMEEPAKFNKTFVSLVRPIVIGNYEN